MIDEARTTQSRELLRAAEALAPTGGDDHRPDRAGTGIGRAAYFLAAAFLAGFLAVARRLVVALQHLVEPRLGGLLVDVERERQLGHEDLARPRQHPLLTRRQALVGLADREVPDDFGDLVDVAALQLLDVVLEPARPVGRHPGLLLAKDREHLLDLFVVDDLAEADLLGVVGRDHEREVAVGEAQHEVVALLAEGFLLLARSMVAAPWWG